jgi:hypothetical protein
MWRRRHDVYDCCALVPGPSGVVICDRGRARLECDWRGYADPVLCAILIQCLLLVMVFVWPCAEESQKLLRAQT